MKAYLFLKNIHSQFLSLDWGREERKRRGVNTMFTWSYMCTPRKTVEVLLISFIWGVKYVAGRADWNHQQ